MAMMTQDQNWLRKSDPSPEEQAQIETEIDAAVRDYLKISKALNKPFYSKAQLADADIYLSLLTERIEQRAKEDLILLQEAQNRVKTIKEDLEYEEKLLAQESAAWGRLEIAVDDAANIGSDKAFPKH